MKSRQLRMHVRMAVRRTRSSTCDNFESKLGMFDLKKNFTENYGRKPVTNGRPFFSLRNNVSESSGR